MSSKLNILLLTFLTLLMVSCKQPNISPLEKVLWSAHPAMLKVLHDPAYFEVQIRFSEIKRDAAGKVSFTDYDFRNSLENYFYPASTVKLPIAILAAEYVDSISSLSIASLYKIKGDSVFHTIEDDIRQIFAISDNDAYNRLYELLGRDYINAKLKSKGILPIRISHRLATENAGKQQRDTLVFYRELDSIYLGGGKDSMIEPLKIKKLQKGIGFMQDGSLVNAPMDFSEKNYFPIEAQHKLMKRLFFPEVFSEKERFNISENSLNIIKKHMYTLPRNNGYDESEFYDSYGKFFLYGDSKERIPAHFKIYNKVGYAYGTLTETAYIVDEKTGIEFLLTATILVNKDEIFNDDTYEYDEIGIPFLAQLGREIYLQEHEK
ncbi:MAG: serine hydrolase [Flavobacteriaceae bacterium]